METFNPSDTTIARLPGWLDVLLHPSCWVQLAVYSRRLDALVCELMESPQPIERRRFNTIIGGYRFWTANHPYASFAIGGFRPARATILRAGRVFGIRGDAEAEFAINDAKGRGL